MYAQKPLLKKRVSGKHIEKTPLQVSPHLPSNSSINYERPSVSAHENFIFSKESALWKVGAVSEYGLPTLIHGGDTPIAASRSNKPNAFDYLNTIKAPLKMQAPEEEFVITKEETDKIGQQHVKIQQYFQGIKVYGGEAWVHNSSKKGFDLYTGKSFPTPSLASTEPSINQEEAIALAMEDVAEHTTVDKENHIQHPLYEAPVNEGELMIFHVDDHPSKERLAWVLTIHPNNVSHWKYFIDAQTGEVLRHFSTICKLDHKVGRACEEENHAPTKHTNFSFGGPETIQALDLDGNAKTISTYELDGRYFMLDVTKSMFNARSSQLPNDPVGAIWTLDARSTSPASRSRFEPAHLSSTTNNWRSDLEALGVSAHSNASITYDYYLNTFNRVSYNGRGSNITSFINVPDENGQDMDNAFWDGKYIYYGNGAREFRPLALSLDVAAHEISHGVVTSTADLEYFGESGAMNEAFADIFAVLITRDDWEIGEDIVNPGTFPGGALRNLADPHNGGTRLGQPGWQPKHLNEAFRGREDNGGVHINSGIINHAFYLHSVDQALGGDVLANFLKTEQIYFRALTRYLTSRSGFRNMRESVILSARDLHGANSVEVAAADRAFAGVGISTPSVQAILNIEETPQEVEPIEIEDNLGRDFVIYTDEQSSTLYIADGDGNVLTGDDFSQPVKSKASVTDDGQFIVYVGQDHRIYLITVDWVEGTFEEEEISIEAKWRNVAVAKDGSRLAAVSENTAISSVDNIISVFDFGIQEWRDFEVYNPTFSEGVTTGTVEFVDALEFDFSGESIMYDSRNSIESVFETAELNYWDIGFIKVWDNDIITRR